MLIQKFDELELLEKFTLRLCSQFSKKNATWVVGKSTNWISEKITYPFTHNILVMIITSKLISLSCILIPERD